MRVLTAQQMQQVDRRAIEELGIPSMVLMENAAIGLAEAVATHFPQATTVTLLCGPGNNGGDGLALARHLDARAYRLQIFLLTRHPVESDGESSLKGDGALQWEILGKAGIAVENLHQDSRLEDAITACRRADLVVDALFGTGLARPLAGHFARLVEEINQLGVPILAVDIPSGLEGSHGTVQAEHVSADVTVTFAAPKVAHLLPPAAEHMGRLVLVDLGIPPYLVEEAPGGLHVLADRELAAFLPRRQAESHKGSYGHVLLVAGSPGKSGAAILAARGAVRGGAGLVTAVVPQPLLDLVDGGCLESMTMALAPEGEVLVSANLDWLVAAVEGKSAAAVGPGLGTAPETQQAIRAFASAVKVPLILDADALNAFAGRLSELAGRSVATMLTPHPGEMGRLLGWSTAEVQADRLTAVKQAAAEAGAVVILKGHRTLVAEPGGEVYINPTGNSGMATGGSGDVLTGFLLALAGQGYDPLVAAQLAVYLHGLAGDLAVEKDAPEALRASDLVEALPQAFARLRGA